MVYSWYTFLLTVPNLSHISCELGIVAQFNTPPFSSDVIGRIFEVRCKICRRVLRADCLVLTQSSIHEDPLATVVKEIHKSNDEEGKQTVLEHLSETKFIVHTRTGFHTDCDCTFRFHQVFASGQYMWYADRQFADEVDTYLDLTSDASRSPDTH